MAVSSDPGPEQPWHAASIEIDGRATMLKPISWRVQQLRGLPDSDLLALIRRGDLDALEVTYDRHIEAVWSVALGFSASTTVAEAAVFAAFARLWQDREAGDCTSLAARLLSNVWREVLLGSAPSIPPQDQ